MMVQVFHNCDAVANWSGVNAAIVLNEVDEQEGTGCIDIDTTNVGDDFYYGFCNPANIDATVDHVCKFYVKPDDVHGAVECVYVLAPGVGFAYTFNVSYRAQLTAGSWELVELDLEAADATDPGVDISDIGEVRIVCYGSAPDVTMVDYIHFEADGAPPAGIKDSNVPRTVPQLLSGSLYNLANRMPKLRPRQII